MKKRTDRHAVRIRQMIENSPSKSLDVANLSHRADHIETDYGDKSLHDALDQTKRDLIRHNKAVLRQRGAGVESPSLSPANAATGLQGRQETQEGDEGEMIRTKEIQLCAAITRAGDPCPCPAQRKRGSEFCFNHDPERAEERRRNARRNAASPNGSRRRLQRIQHDLPRAQRLVLEFVEKTMAGELTPHQAKQVQNVVQATHALNRCASIELQYREHAENTGKPPEQASGVIEELAGEAERLMEEVIEGEAPAYYSRRLV